MTKKLKSPPAADLIKSLSVDLGYNEAVKKKFHQQAEQVLKALASELGYAKADYDLRHNIAGIAVSGEITLHSDTLYVQFSQNSAGLGGQFMWRTVKHRRDYSGGPNQWMRWTALENLRYVAETMQTAVKRRQQQAAAAEPPVGPYSGLTKQELQASGTLETDWY